jgi:murein DD-endopeptidase MepM/ murein hydrolase activator NlpD
MRRAALTLALTAVIATWADSPARGEGSPQIAALQVALRAKGVYRADIDGVIGPGTRTAVRRLQQRAGLTVDGVVGPHTRHALGRLGRHRLGSRLLLVGGVGWDVAALQFQLAWHGFASGAFDGVFGLHTNAALRRFQRHAGLAVDGVAGPLTLRAVRRAPPGSPLALQWPLRAGVSSGFGPRGDRFHEGVDLAAPRGTPVRAAAGGVVGFTGWDDGFGKLVVVEHDSGVTTYYAHLSRISVTQNERVRPGHTVGRVGATGEATGPHLHFEVHVRGAAIDPLTALH